jgi:formylmethanofuran dehydrogenase subunit E
MQYSDIIDFHGHSCPGLAIGYRMSLAAMTALRVTRSEDEELVAVVETDACGVDALQYLTGCTFGKGNLQFRDYGKSVYTLYSRTSGRGVRVVFHGQGLPTGIRDDKPAFIKYLLTCPDESILAITENSDSPPKPARIRNSVICEICREPVMETRLRDIGGLPACIPCAEIHSKQSQ